MQLFVLKRKPIMVLDINQQKYLAIDLELNSNGEGKTTKIIQVGIAIGSLNDQKNIQTYKWYVDPKEPLTNFIIGLTGITQQDIDDKAVGLDVIAAEIGKLIDENNTFANPVQWGMGDAEQLKTEFEQNNILFPYFGNRVIDVKTLYTFLQSAKGSNVKGGLSSCMAKYKLQFKGLAHRADVDAYNTLLFYFALLERQSKLEQMLQFSKGIT